MNKNHLIAILAVLVTGFGLILQGAQPIEVTVQGQALLPGRDEDWASAGGFDAQLRFWQTENMGIALVVGAASWKAVAEYSESDDGETAVATSIDGSAHLLPVGLSLLYREETGQTATIMLEAGIRYVLCDSEVRVKAAYATDETSGLRHGTIEIGNTLLAVLGLGFDIVLSKSIGLLVGIHYQFDLLKPEERLWGQSLGSTSFDAAAASIGLRLSF
ncbi:MAG: hypothetical protein ACUVWX_10090 [Kiritimatiellia bacterium]